MKENLQDAEKPTLLDLREKYSVNILSLAEISGVNPATVYCMLLDRPVSNKNASQVLEGLSMLVGANYTMNNVNVILSDE